MVWLLVWNPYLASSPVIAVAVYVAVSWITSRHSSAFGWAAIQSSSRCISFVLFGSSSRKPIFVILQVVVYLAFYPSENPSHVLVIVGVFFACTLNQPGW
jgi:hypothetical protein